MPHGRIGIIGGSGLYEMEGLEDIREVRPQTPFGAPSDALIIGRTGALELVFLPRHGRGHRIAPTEIPVRANIYALKALGVKRLISVSAVGSMRKRIRPLDLVIPDQVIDRTKSRVSSFFGNGIVAHCGFAEPFCPNLSATLAQVAKGSGVRLHLGGTYLCIEGPQFSTKAESALYRQWGVDIIGMTAIPEAKLAREAEMCYATLAFATDYDVWHKSAGHVSVEMVVKNLAANVEKAQQIIREAAVHLASAEPLTCQCQNALQNAVITAPERFPVETRRALALLLDKYFPR
ncbi:MAG: S-methyl-5'-thioadenosine phosphorylase [Chloroflexi bacterium]|nr:S-methyl-5'-thioadenosine phosphorylase [Chloroflexota bacterium]MCL5946731.1 S-methyl-5'-thioadenosine phosphorylase [Chloroflexota bacterium]